MQKNLTSKFSGSVGKMFGINLGCFFLSIIPIFGLPIAICIRQKWLMENTKIVGIQLEFNGKPMDLLGKMIVWGFYFIITLTVYSIWIPTRYLEWKTQHTVFGPVERM